MTSTVGIIAHHARSEAAHTLFDTIGATYMHMDNGFWGCKRSHLRTWEYLEKAKTPWAVCIEDDAEPVDNFRHQLDQALAHAPTPIVGLYLGQGYPPQLQQRIGQAVAKADREQAHWIVADNHLHGVGIAIHTTLIPSMLEWVRRSPHVADTAIRDWARNNNHLIGFCWPSLLDHADGPSLASHKDGGTRNVERKAWRVGGRDHWTQRQVTL